MGGYFSETVDWRQALLNSHPYQYMFSVVCEFTWATATVAWALVQMQYTTWLWSYSQEQTAGGKEIKGEGKKGGKRNGGGGV